MHAGGYNEVVKIYNPVVTKNSVGANTTTWNLKYTTRANVLHTGGNRVVVENEIFYDCSKTLVMRSYVPINDEDRVLFQGKYYRVTNIDHRREYNDIEVRVELVNE